MRIETAFKWVVLGAVFLLVLSVIGVVQSKVLEQAPVPGCSD
jgi:hypothetical protein